MDYIIDTTVLMDASGVGEDDKMYAAAQLIERLKTDDSAMLTQDKKGRINAEYENRIGNATLARKFLRTKLDKELVRYIRTVSLPGNIRQELRKVRFHSDDRKFLETAYFATKQQIENLLVYRETRWVPHVPYLKRIGVRCCQAHEV